MEGGSEAAIDDNAEGSDAVLSGGEREIPPVESYETVRVKYRALATKGLQRILPKGGPWGFFGWQLVMPHHKAVIITEGEYDAMAVAQALMMLQPDDDEEGTEDVVTVAMAKLTTKAVAAVGDDDNNSSIDDDATTTKTKPLKSKKMKKSKQPAEPQLDLPALQVAALTIRIPSISLQPYQHHFCLTHSIIKQHCTRQNIDIWQTCLQFPCPTDAIHYPPTS